ncbi:segregation and condensation protein A [Candidatus Venteria ishoeyi]|uniref:Segregation and condensation protein A n=1 Tax=Candidatus Venteria ishoeyi TaxID=1899563 RepID=A0A1H6FBH2_9GAMM|nr:segregation and condensation protein A [Candidatus Venteria ishoeyi]MDM8544882.1 segregation and condensation protein A [Candidatus Venteria ishoeyi]SEH07442.1 Uncharacterised protein [Candidatus Venteria ishoeyi]
MSFENLSKEQQILVTMRKVLSSVARDTAPKPGVVHPLSEQTVTDIRMCLGLIAARERELAEAAGIQNTARPHYVDEHKTSHAVAIDQLKKS